MCELKIKVNTHCEKNPSYNQALKCDIIMLGDMYLARIFRQWDD